MTYKGCMRSTAFKIGYEVVRFARLMVLTWLGARWGQEYGAWGGLLGSVAGAATGSWMNISLSRPKPTTRRARPRAKLPKRDLRRAECEVLDAKGRVLIKLPCEPS